MQCSCRHAKIQLFYTYTICAQTNFYPRKAHKSLYEFQKIGKFSKKSPTTVKLPKNHNCPSKSAELPKYTVFPETRKHFGHILPKKPKFLHDQCTYSHNILNFQVQVQVAAGPAGAEQPTGRCSALFIKGNSHSTVPHYTALQIHALHCTALHSTTGTDNHCAIQYIAV